MSEQHKALRDAVRNAILLAYDEAKDGEQPEAMARAAINAVYEALKETTPEMRSAIWAMRMSNTKESFDACMEALLDASPLAINKQGELKDEF